MQTIVESSRFVNRGWFLRFRTELKIKFFFKKRLWTSLLWFIEQSDPENHDKMTHKKKYS